MSQEPEFVSYVKGCYGCLVLLVIAALVIAAVGVGTVVIYIVLCAVALGVGMWLYKKTG
ncbi:hypothetical protein [Actinacidiphila glaucinigra]|uniref:hypothetical protein n=1 Tax=Actinacidiphila glaucinigra TaxID=235986 RepID=UPI00366AC4E0